MCFSLFSFFIKSVTCQVKSNKTFCLFEIKQKYLYLYLYYTKSTFVCNFDLKHPRHFFHSVIFFMAVQNLVISEKCLMQRLFGNWVCHIESEDVTKTSVNVFNVQRRIKRTRGEDCQNLEMLLYPNFFFFSFTKSKINIENL